MTPAETTTNGAASAAPEVPEVTADTGQAGTAEQRRARDERAHQLQAEMEKIHAEQNEERVRCFRAYMIRDARRVIEELDPRGERVRWCAERLSELTYDEADLELDTSFDAERTVKNIGQVKALIGRLA